MIKRHVLIIFKLGVSSFEVTPHYKLHKDTKINVIIPIKLGFENFANVQIILDFF